MAIKARELGFKGLILPKANVTEAAVVNNLEVYGVENLREVMGFFRRFMPSGADGNQYPRGVWPSSV